MRGISEVRLKQIAHETHDSDDTNLPVLSLLDLLISECQELNTWMTLDEFLKSGFEGECWICTREKEIIKRNFNGVVFSHGRRRIIPVTFVTHVQPIHKPEPPR